MLYIPVYDLLRPAKGPVTVLEVFLSARAPQDVLVPDILSAISNTLASLQLSVANPVPQPIKRSGLSGRRVRYGSGDGSSRDGIGRDEDEVVGARALQPPGAGVAVAGRHGCQARGSSTGADGQLASQPRQAAASCPAAADVAATAKEADGLGCRSCSGLTAAAAVAASSAATAAAAGRGRPRGVSEGCSEPCRKAQRLGVVVQPPMQRSMSMYALLPVGQPAVAAVAPRGGGSSGPEQGTPAGRCLGLPTPNTLSA